MTRFQANADIHTTDPSRIQVLASFHVKDKIKAVQGAKWNNDERVWTVPLSWPACLALRTEFGDDLVIGPALREWAQATAQIKKAALALRGNMTGDPGIGKGLPGFAELFPHQRVDAEGIFLARRYLLMNETGTGKSRSALAGLSLLRAGGVDIFPLLIIAPKSILINWSREVEGFFPGADVRVCSGTPAKVRKALEPGGDVYVIAWGSLRSYSRQAPYGSTEIKPEDRADKELQKIGFKAAVCDEVHRGKSGKAQWTRAAWQATKPCETVISMTGTPLQESVQDLWAVLRLTAPADYPTKSGYMERFVNVEENYWGGREVVGLKDRTRDEFFKNFDAMSRRVTKDVALDLPDKMYEVRWVQLPPKNRKAYEQMLKTLMAELDSGVIMSSNVLVRGSRLMQMANATCDITAEGALKMMEPSPKIDAFMQDLADGDFDGQQLAIFSDSRQLADLLVAQMIKKKYQVVCINGDSTTAERQEAVDLFQGGHAQHIVFTRAGGEGMTLTAASTMVRLVRPWSYIVYKQAEDRTHRIGSEIHDKIVYVDYITEDTVEEGQMVKLNNKEANAQEILRDADSLREIINLKL